MTGSSPLIGITDPAWGSASFFHPSPRQSLYLLPSQAPLQTHQLAAQWCSRMLPLNCVGSSRSYPWLTKSSSYSGEPNSISHPVHHSAQPRVLWWDPQRLGQSNLGGELLPELASFQTGSKPRSHLPPPLIPCNPSNTPHHSWAEPSVKISGHTLHSLVVLSLFFFLDSYASGGGVSFTPSSCLHRTPISGTWATWIPPSTSSV